METPIRLIIADDHELFRQGLKSLLLQDSDVVVAAEVGRASDLLPILTTVPCDVLLLDLQMERWVVSDIEQLAGYAKIVVLTASERPADAVGAMRLGARAVVQKRFAIESLMEAIRTVVNGLVWMPPAVQAELLALQRGVSTTEELTRRECEIVSFVATGLRNAEVAQRLSITESTVKTHLNRIFQKLGLRDRVELALYAMQTGLAKSEDRPR
jgi:two-component system nitrate/nitrite response regulator NarL